MEVKVSNIKGAGLGVFATKDYKKDELIERSGFVYIETSPPDLTVHCFDSGDPKKNIVYFGKMTLVNHAKVSNVTYDECPIYKRIMEFHTTRDIAKGEEFVLNYCYETGKDPWYDNTIEKLP